MDRTVCELFAGVGGFRCGLNGIKDKDGIGLEMWDTVWFNQWEPSTKTQWAHACYTDKFGTRLDMAGEDTTNTDIHLVNKKNIPDHNLLVGGFPCQDYSVASTLSSSKGIEGKKGVLWWDIRDILEAKGAPFVLLENVDRLIKSPAKQRGRDFGIILACFRDLGYTVEWRVINAAEYGLQQRRRRTFIFAYKENTKYAGRMEIDVKELLLEKGFFATGFPVEKDGVVRMLKLPKEIGEVSESFSFQFENTGLMRDGVIYTTKTVPVYDGDRITMGDLLEDGAVDESLFIPEEKLYYTDPEVTGCDETAGLLSDAAHRTWQYIKGGKKIMRQSGNGHEYVYSEGSMPMLDAYDKPARTLLTSEGSFGRTTHIVEDRMTGRIRLLTAVEAERIQGFPDDWTKECVIDGKRVKMPEGKRRFMMGNALVVNLVEKMEKVLYDIFDKE